MERERRESLFFSARVRRIVSQLVEIPNRACGHSSAERASELERVLERAREKEIKSQMKSNRGAEVVR